MSYDPREHRSKTRAEFLRKMIASAHEMFHCKRAMSYIDGEGTIAVCEGRHKFFKWGEDGCEGAVQFATSMVDSAIESGLLKFDE